MYFSDGSGPPTVSWACGIMAVDKSAPGEKMGEEMALGVKITPAEGVACCWAAAPDPEGPEGSKGEKTF